MFSSLETKPAGPFPKGKGKAKKARLEDQADHDMGEAELAELDPSLETKAPPKTSGGTKDKAPQANDDVAALKSKKARKAAGLAAPQAETTAAKRTKVLGAVEKILSALDGLSGAEKMEAIRMIGGSLKFNPVPTATALGLFSAGPAPKKEGKKKDKKETKVKTQSAPLPKANPLVAAAKLDHKNLVDQYKAAGADMNSVAVRDDIRVKIAAIKEARRAAKTV